MPAHHRGRGFTLIELIVSIVLISIISLAAAPLLRIPLTTWLDASRRAELSQSLDIVHAKLADDLQRALPNSVRLRQVGPRLYLETLEVRAWGRARAGSSSPAAQACPALCSATPGLEDVLEAGCNENCFTSLGQLNGDTPVPGTDWVVVNPLGPGIPNGDPYFGGNVAVAGGIKTRLSNVAPAADGNRIDVAAHNFPALSAGNRFYIVATPVTWECNANTLRLTRYWNYPVSAVQPVAFAPGTPSAPLATTVTNCNAALPPFRYQRTGSLNRGGIVHVSLQLTGAAANGQPGERVQFVASLPVSEGP